MMGRSLKAEIILAQEGWDNDKMAEAYGYSVTRENGKAKAIIATRTGLKMNESEIEQQEYSTCIKLPTEKGTINILSIYVPPAGKNQAKGRTQTVNMLEKLKTEYIISISDLNPTKDGGWTKETLETYDLITMNNPDTPTRIENGKESMLDLIICSKALTESLRSHEVMLDKSGRSDHAPFITEWSFRKSTIQSRTRPSATNIAKGTLQILKNQPSPSITQMIQAITANQKGTTKHSKWYLKDLAPLNRNINKLRRTLKTERGEERENTLKTLRIAMLVALGRVLFWMFVLLKDHSVMIGAWSDLPLSSCSTL